MLSHPDVSRPGCARSPPPGRCRGRTGPRPHLYRATIGDGSALAAGHCD